MSVPITLLQPFTEYNFSVKAFNGAGLSPMSSLVSVRTGEDLPENPTQVQAEIIIESEGEALHVHWSSPLRPNGIILHYTVYYQEYVLICTLTKCPFLDNLCLIFL